MAVALILISDIVMGFGATFIMVILVLLILRDPINNRASFLSMCYSQRSQTAIGRGATLCDYSPSYPSGSHYYSANPGRIHQWLFLKKHAFCAPLSSIQASFCSFLQSIFGSSAKPWMAAGSARTAAEPRILC